MPWDFGPLTKAVISLEGGQKSHTVLVNPAELSMQVKVRYADNKTVGKADTDKQFISIDNDTMDFTLYYDGFLAKADEPEDVSKHIKELLTFAEIKGTGHEPPLCRFIWGSIDVKCRIVQLRYSYTMFTPDGKPIRARAQLGVEILREQQAGKESPDRTKWRVTDGDACLWRLAHEEYGDAGLWRYIADANGIRNPRKVPHGMELSVPAIH